MTEGADPTALIGVPLTKAQKQQVLAEARALSRLLLDKITLLAEDTGEEGGAADDGGDREPPRDPGPA